MAVRIRLKRFGNRNRPFYRIVVAESTTPRNGKTIDEIGTYDPTKTPVQLNLDTDSVKKWLEKGATPSDTVHRLFAGEGLVEKKKRTSSNLGVAKKDLKKSDA